MGARIFECFHIHLHADRTAFFSVATRLGRGVEAQQAVSCNGCYTQGRCARQEFTTVKLAVLHFLRVHLCGWMHEIVFLGHVFLPVTPYVITDCALGR